MTMMNRLLPFVIATVIVCSLAPLGAAEPKTERLETVQVEAAFPAIRITRPIVLTHAGDGTNRVFVASQLGKIHVFPNDQAVKKTQVFLDISSRVTYKRNQNEEGFLGLAFHPQYKSNGKFYVYYTTSSAPHTSVVSQFRVSADDPQRADPKSEVQLLRIKQPFWNHNGGTVVFGPDGKLYIALGDGGAANDPLQAGQNLKTWLGSILRIDVDRQDQGRKYGVPQDNPFVGRASAAPEIYAYGLRNVWRLTFDRKTGVGWIADVGQDRWEEINLLTKGGNYGWSAREGKHPFRPNRARGKSIEPIWEYHHGIGKSITGGYVYRGKRVPALSGKYLFADFVTGKIWALDYDHAAKRVTRHFRIPASNAPVMSFGEDEAGEVYFMTDLRGGQLFRFAPKGK